MKQAGPGTLCCSVAILAAEHTLSNKIQGNCMGLKITACTVRANFGPNMQKPTNPAVTFEEPGTKAGYWGCTCTQRHLLVLLLLSRLSVRLCATPQTAAHHAPHPWDSPGKNTGVGCHFLLQCMKVKSESEAAQSCPTLRDPMDCSPPGSSVHGIFQARVLEWGAIAFSNTT